MTDEMRVPPASYWPQTFDAVWDHDGVTCDAEIPVVPAARLTRAEEVLRQLGEAESQNRHFHETGSLSAEDALASLCTDISREVGAYFKEYGDG